MMNWVRSQPTEAGIYLRNNPPIIAVVRQDVGQIGQELFIVLENNVVKLPNPQFDKWLWYGPIPEPPR